MFNKFGTSSTRFAILLAILSGVVFAFLTPLSAVFLQDSQPVFTVAALNLGAGIGMALLLLCGRKTKLAATSEKPTRKDIPVLICIVIGDLLGALLSMLSLTFAAADSISLILNFEIISTALIAFCFFKEKVSKRLGIAIVLITLGCIAVTAGDLERFIASPGIILALLSCVCWGITHNLYRKVSYQNPHGILTVRGLGIGVIAFIISLIIGEGIPAISLILIMMLIGFATYGLGNIFFVLSQRKLGAALVSAISGFSPFLAAFISLLIFQEYPTLSFVIALLLLIPGVYIAVTEGVVNKQASGLGGDTASIPQKTSDIRNTLSAIGYFAIASLILYYALSLLALPSIVPDVTAQHMLAICGAAFLILIGIILIILRKRDFNGITLIVLGVSLILFVTISSSTELQSALGIFNLIISGIFLLSEERKKYIMSVLFFILGGFFIISSLVPERPIVLSFVLATCFFIIGISSSALLPERKLTKILTADEHTSFEKSGAMIGYIFFGFSMVPWILLYLTGVPAADSSTIANLTLICAGVLTLIGILMIFVGKSWFTGGIFLGVAFVTSLAIIGGGVVYFVIAILMMIFGLLAALRKPSYLLLGLMFIIYGISAISSFSIAGIMQIQFVQLLLNLVPCLIAIYLAMATFAQKRKLPLF